MPKKEIETEEFGTVEVEEKEIITFPQGLPGFAGVREFVMLPLKEGSPFLILQSVEEPDTAFVTLEPVSFTTEYEFEIGEKTQEILDIENESDVGVVVIVNQNGEDDEIFVNLSAPVVINVRNNLARQVILEQDQYPLRHPIKLKSVKEGNT